MIAAFGVSTPAYACTIDDPTDCPTYTVTHDANLTVSTTRGTITSNPSGISCPSDCAEDYAYEDFCTALPRRDECSDGIPTDVTLTASGGGTGYAPVWSGCAPAGNACTLTMDVDQSVSVTWLDIANPSVGLLSPAAKAGPATVFTAIAADNSGVVSKVDFYVDDVLRATDTSPPYQYKPDLASLADGSSHTLKVIATDGSSRQSSAATSPFTVDKSTGLTGVTTPAAYSQSAPAISFTSPADATVVCRTKLGGIVTGSTSGCSSPYAPQGVATDGAYTVELAVSDNVGNVATITRSFTRDTGAPSLTVSSPASGATLTSPFTPTVAVGDGFAPADQITVECQLDAGPFGVCGSFAPADGAHTLNVRATDLAGNSSQQPVPFTYATPSSGAAGSGGGAGGSTPTDVPGTPSGGSGTPAGGSGTPSPSKVKLASAFKLVRGGTLVTKLTLGNLAKGAKVTLSCKGGGCAFKTTKLTARGAQLALVSKFKKRKLAPKAVITVVVRNAGKSQAFRYTVRSKQKPKVALA